MPLYGPDLSSWKPLGDARRVKAAGNDFLFTKVTGGLSYENPLYGDQIAKARDADLIAGHFHFFTESDSDPCEVQSDYVTQERAEAEAAHFVAFLDWRPGELLFVDVEDKRVVVEQSQAVLWFCDYVERKTGVRPLIYTYPYYMRDYLKDPRLAKYPLWFAEYNDPQIYGTAQWPRWTIRQYAIVPSVPGVDATEVDMNIFLGTREELRALGMPQGAAVRPTVAGALLALAKRMFRGA